MRSTSWIKTIAGQGLISALVLSTGTLYAAGWYDTTTISGYVQGTYVANLSKDTPNTNQLRVYDSNNGFGLNQTQLKLSKPVADDSAGFNVKMLMGRDAGSIHSAGLGTESTSFDLEEANMTFNVPKVSGLTVTGGKFVTTAGVEVIESPSNLMIEPGLLFFYGMPFTHTGAKLGYTVNDKLSLATGLVNGWDQATDANSGKTVLLNVSATPLKGLLVNLTGSYGPELFGGSSSTTSLPSGNANISDRTFADLVVGYTGIDKLTLNAEYLWGQDSNVGGIADSGDTPWSGVGLWAGYAHCPILNPGIRFEAFRDQNNAARLAGANQTAKNITLVNKFIVNSNTSVRLEYRHDWSNVASYRRSDGTAVRNQNTISADWVVTF